MLTNSKPLGIDKRPHEIPRTEWMDNSAALQDGVNNITADYWRIQEGPCPPQTSDARLFSVPFYTKSAVVNVFIEL